MSRLSRYEAARYFSVSLTTVCNLTRFKTGSTCSTTIFFQFFSLLVSSSSEVQFGFQKGKSTESALLLQKEIILENIEKRLLTLAVFIDYSKAFDCLNHITLLSKLYKYGVRGVPFELLKSYLDNRQQSVTIDGQRSPFSNIVCGVPQGSILGPLLFNAYINDVVNITDQAQFIIYADDTSLLFSGNDADELIKRANFVLEIFFLWSDINGLKINTLKSKAILFRPVNKLVNITNPLKIGTASIELVHQHKTLGVYFSEHDMELPY